MLLGTAVCFPTRNTACFRRPGRFQGHGCVPLDELFLTGPTGGRPGDPRRLALRKEIAFRFGKQRTCAYGTLIVPHPYFFEEFRSRDGCLQGHGCVLLDEIYFTAPTGGRTGDPRRLALRMEIALRSQKQRPCAYASLHHRAFSRLDRVVPNLRSP